MDFCFAIRSKYIKYIFTFSKHIYYIFGSLTIIKIMNRMNLVIACILTGYNDENAQSSPAKVYNVWA